jgi:5-methylcytosine-specific restriction endonuclease McrA
VDTIAALERLVCVATAAQAALSADLAASQRTEQEAAGVPAARLGRGVAAQVALARRESPHRGQRHLALATVVRRELPATWAAWRTGRITEWKATLIARETACLTLQDRLAVDRFVAGDPDRLESLGERELVAAVRSESWRLDPAAEVLRRRRAESERCVTLRPAPDTMCYLTALLPVVQGVAAYAALGREAEAARRSGDPRSRGQVMADTMAAAILATATERHDAATRWDAEGGRADASASPTVGVTVHLLMSERALLGCDDEPALLDGYGPVPAELAREIVAGACSDEEEVWVRRVLSCPATGRLAAMESRARRFPASLARFIRLRDGTCRTPWCDAPIRHVDHVLPHDAGGGTSVANGQGLCEACNHAKQAPGWRARPDPLDGRITITTPTGHRHTSRAPDRRPRTKVPAVD